MDTTKKLDDLEKETLQLVLEEQAQEQANNTRSLNDLIVAINTLTGRVNDFEAKLDKPKPITVSADTRPVQEIVKKGITDVKLIIGTKPVPVIKKFQILLFPEQDAKLFYKIVFGPWFLSLVLMLLITNLYKLSVHWSDNRKEIQWEELENDRIKNAWQYLYSHQSKAGKRVMDSVLTRENSIGLKR